MSLTSKFKKLYDYYCFHPENIIIEPTNKCNLVCSICFRSQLSETPIPEGFMDLELFKEILLKCKGNVKNISLYFRGESLLHPELIQFVEMSKTHEFSVNISTNGLLLNKALMEELIRSGLDRIIIDYDYIFGDDYEAIRCIKKSDVVFEKIMSFYETKKRLKSNIPEIVIKALNRGYDPKIVMAYVKRLKKTGFVGKVQISDYFPWPNIKIQSKFSYNLTPKARVCNMYYQGMTITYQGDVLTCSYDHQEGYSVGNIGNFDSVADIYKDAAYRLFRRHLLLKRYQKQAPCNNCLLPVMNLAGREYTLNNASGGIQYA